MFEDVDSKLSERRLVNNILLIVLKSLKAKNFFLRQKSIINSRYRLEANHTGISMGAVYVRSKAVKKRINDETTKHVPYDTYELLK